MSCHNIGRGMDSVTKVVAQMYINNEITKDVAFRLFKALRKGVNWCDGNEYEATESISEVLCGRCLKQYSDGEKPVNLYYAEDVLNSKIKDDKEAGDALSLRYRELYKTICEKRNSDHIISFNNSTYWDILSEETATEHVCEECFIDILQKYANRFK